MTFPKHNPNNVYSLPKREVTELTVLCYLEEDSANFYLYPDPEDATFYTIEKSRVTELVVGYSALNTSRGVLATSLITFRVPEYVQKATILTFKTFEEEIKNRSLITTATLRANIDFLANGEGVLKFNGKSYPCLGNNTVNYLKDITVQQTDKFPVKWSTEFQVNMELAVLIHGNRGIYIHFGMDTLASNGGISAGCIHVQRPQIEEFYKWLTGPTRILTTYPWG